MSTHASQLDVFVFLLYVPSNEIADKLCTGPGEVKSTSIGQLAIARTTRGCGAGDGGQLRRRPFRRDRKYRGANIRHGTSSHHGSTTRFERTYKHWCEGSASGNIATASRRITGHEHRQARTSAGDCGAAGEGDQGNDRADDNQLQAFELLVRDMRISDKSGSRWNFPHFSSHTLSHNVSLCKRTKGGYCHNITVG